MLESTVQADGPVSQFGPGIPSQVDETVTIFKIKEDLKSLVGEANLIKLANALSPFVAYDPVDPLTEGGKYLRIQSPSIHVPFYGDFQMRAYAGFEIDAALNLHYGWDFGNLGVSAKVSAPRVDGEQAYNVFIVDTTNVSIAGFVNSIPATGDFYISLNLEGTQTDSNGHALPGLLKGGVFNAGAYRDGSPYITTNIGIDTPLNEEIFGIHIAQGEATAGFSNKYLNGSINIPQLPLLSASVSGTGASALQQSGDASGVGPNFAGLTMSPLNFIPLLGEINSNSIGLFTPLIDVGLDYTLLKLDVSLGAALRQNLSVTIKSVGVEAEAWEDIGEDADHGAAREALDQADGTDDNRVLVSSATGVLGDRLELENFTQGARHNTRIDEFYSITLTVKTDVDIVLNGGINFAALSFSAFVNPILIDELRIAIGPLFSTGFNFEIAAIDVFNKTFDVVLTSKAKISHTITTFVDYVGTPGPDFANVASVPQQVSYAGLGGNDSVVGNGQNNVFDGNAGNDVITGGTGNDTLRGGSGSDTIYGDDGNDVIDAGRSGAAPESVSGGAGNDAITIDSPKGVFDGGSGDDTITGKLNVTGGQSFVGGSGSDVLILDASSTGIAYTLDFSTGPNGTILTFGATSSTYSGFERFGFTGSASDDALTGSLAADTLRGQGGNDTIAGGYGSDVLDGGADNDSLSGGADNDTIYGAAGNDSIYGDAKGEGSLGGADYIDAGGGDDRVESGGGNDTVLGGDGNDTIVDRYGDNDIFAGAGDDSITAGGAGTRIFASGGNDTVKLTSGDIYLNAGDGADTIEVTGAGSTVYGGLGADFVKISANIGPGSIDGEGDGETDASIDTLVVTNFSTATTSGGSYTPPASLGVTGTFTVLGFSGTFASGATWNGFEAFDITGDAGDQRLVGGAHADRLAGGMGNDYLDGGNGNDTLIGGNDNDTLVGSFGDKFDGGWGTDLLVFKATGLSNDLTIDLGAVTSVFGSGDFTTALTGQRVGSISLSSDSALSGIVPASPASNFGSNLMNIEQLRMVGASSGDDTISGGDMADTINGGAGRDVIVGYGGNDAIDSGSGSDNVHGGAGNDTITDTDVDPAVVRGGDVLFGDGGNDTVYATRHAASVFGGDGDDRIFILNGGTAVLGVDRSTIDGGAGADSISGSDADEEISGGVDYVDSPPGDPDLLAQPETVRAGADGNDTIDAGGGNDVVSGGSGNDSLLGGSGGDTINGGSGNDVVDGGADDDSLGGGSGNDTLRGGSGIDTLDGGSGNDSMLGGDDRDFMTFGDGNDTGDGGAGDDSMTGGTGADSLIGNDGNDSIDLGDGNDLGNGGMGDDTVLGGLGFDNLDGGAGDDVLAGGDGNDTLSGGAGSDSLDGGAGNDFIVDRDTLGGSTLTGDTIDGGAGNDTIQANLHAERVLGGDGNDVIAIADSGTPGLYVPAVRVEGGGGADSILGSASGDVLYGGSGVAIGEGGGIAVGIVGTEGGPPPVTIQPDGNDTIMAGGGNDTVFGNDGNDSIDGGEGADLIHGGSGDDRLFGGANGEDLGDTIFGDAGRDSIVGSDGLDSLEGGDGDDTIEGGAANSLGGGSDTLNGGAGADRIVSGGDAAIDGGDGNDRIVLSDGAQVITMRFGPGTASGNDVIENFVVGSDVLRFVGKGFGSERMVLTDQADGLLIGFGTASTMTVKLLGVHSNDLGPGTIEFYEEASAGNDAIWITANEDVTVNAAILLANDRGTNLAIRTMFSGDVLVTGSTDPVRVLATATGGYFEYDAGNVGNNAFARVEVGAVVTTVGDDTIVLGSSIGGVAANGAVIDLKAGNDSAIGTAGRDMLTGGLGNDTLRGGAGHDTLDGGDGADSLFGDGGDDSLTGGAGNDTLTGSDGRDTLVGGTGNDTYFIRNSTDQTVVEAVGEGYDRVYAYGNLTLGANVEEGQITLATGASLTGNELANKLLGGVGNDSLYGLSGADTLVGGLGDDTLYGGDDNDWLDGGAGSNELTGGLGADRFVFRSVDIAANNRILDFDAAQGDRIDLSAIDANLLLPRNEAFTLVGALTGVAGQLVVTAIAGAMPSYSVQGDVDGDGIADFTIVVVSSQAPVAADFVL